MAKNGFGELEDHWTDQVILLRTFPSFSNWLEVMAKDYGEWQGREA